ncbi:MAG: hypothetical protein DRO05_06480 [Thermoproteota archaeon]|nr:MAG: hypothetical protein DRO05_06480 [Candidatus Korarchaeota archaeon]
MISDEEIKEEVTELLSKLIRIDTTNPPGNETPAAELLYDYLSSEGYEPEILEYVKGRGNLITSLKGEGKTRLMLLSHLDVVPADPRKWRVHPFSGEVRDGFIWGRGAHDCKGLAACEAVAMAILKREGFKPKGEVIFAATADEERGALAGARWLVEAHPEKVRVDYMINEGGGLVLPIKGKNHYFVQVAEKGVFWIKLRTRGRSAHSSMPKAGVNALMKMVEVLHKLGLYKPPSVPTKEVKEFLRRIVGEFESVEEAIARLEREGPWLAEGVRTNMMITMVPTMIKAGIKENVIPDECETVVDCRLPADFGLDYLKDQLRKALGSLEDVEIEVIGADPGTSSPYDTIFFRKIEESVSKFDPGAVCVPSTSNGGTDSRFFRAKFGTIAYGFRVTKLDVPLDEFRRMVHGVDERISQENLVYRTKMLVDIVKRVMG